MGVDGEKERISAEIIRSGAVSPSEPILPVVNPAIVSEKRPETTASKIHPAFYVTTWITLSSSIIIFNKWILDDGGFHYPVTLTCWHLFFATVMTQIMSRTTTLLDGRKTVKMTGKIYVRAIVPIGAFFSLSLICGNITYLYLGVAFIQMLKVTTLPLRRRNRNKLTDNQATTPVAVLLAGWAIGTEKANMNTLFKVSFIVIGVVIASFGEIEFVFIGFLFQLGGIVFEALRLVMVQKLLSSAEYKMDPLVSLYYFAPICAMMNFCVAAVIEIPHIKMDEVYHVGLITLLANACIAFALNVSVVFLIGRTSSLVLTLCGVLKDILLVFASIAIWGKPVTALQFFGYSIALAGLVYFKLGADTIKAKFSDAGRAWADYGVRHPALRKIIVFFVAYLACPHTMEETEQNGEEQDVPPSHLFERLSYLSGYTWDQSIEPFHSSYDNWHVFGIQQANPDKAAIAPASAVEGAPSSASSRSSHQPNSKPPLRHHNTSSDALSELASTRTEQERTFTPVIARVSAHSLRLEREYHLGKAFIQTSDPDCHHTVRLIGLTRLPIRQNDSGPLAVEIFESPGRNYLRDLTDFGPAWYVSKQQSVKSSEDLKSAFTVEPRGKIPLGTFLDFAIGASECLELLHHGLKVVHGEIRADAFHFNRDTGIVKLVNFGSGARSFEHAGGLTSSGWSTLSRQTGIKNRLMFIAPEQTGRMSAEPDYRTDIYSLGILFWTMLAGEPAYDGLTPMDIVQAVLAKRVPPISNLRFDVPDVLSGIIQRMTQKQIDDRYHATSGLKHDLVELRRILGEGDSEGLIDFQIGSKDVSSSFVLPTVLLGRSQERRRIVQAMEKVVLKQQSVRGANGSHVHSLTSATASTMSDSNEIAETVARSSEVSSQETKEGEVGSGSAVTSSENTQGDCVSLDGDASPPASVTADRPPLETDASRQSVETTTTMDSQISSGTRNTHRSKPPSAIVSKGPTQHRYRNRRRCEVITIYGQAGLGKSSLIQATQGEIRRLGYFTAAKFDPARKVPFDTMLHALKSLFHQIFSESDIHTPYHNYVRASVRPIWSSLRSMLDLPENLVAMETPGTTKPSVGNNFNKILQMESDTTSSLSARSANLGGSFSMTDFVRGGASAYSSKLSSIFLDVMRILASSKMICLSFDDVQFADEESLDLICNILSRKLGLVVIFTCREAEQVPKSIRSILDSGATNMTTIALAPLTEEQVIDYVASTMSRSPGYVQSLAVVCLEKTNGNPFYLKQMLEVCYRRGCIWYSWKDSAWEYDLDRVFTEFESDAYGEQLNSAFILKRLQDLPPASRAILAWGSLIGTTFSFSLVQKLLGGDFELVDVGSDQRKLDCSRNAEAFSSLLADTAVEGLQALTQAYILMPTSDEHFFSFSHDRYVQASASLRECHDVEKMHFYIAQTLMKYFSADHHSLHTRAQHICQAARLIKDKVQHRSRYREVLSQAAHRAIDAGARPTALQYFDVCLDLMQARPWEEGLDVYYEETLDVFTRAAQLYWHQGHIEKAMQLASQALEATTNPADRAPLWIITSRLLSQQGDLAGAFQALKASMIELGVEWERSLTLDELDVQFEDRKNRILEADAPDALIKPLVKDANRARLGAVLTEAISAAFWSDATMANIHFALRCQEIGHGILEQYRDPYTYGRSLALNAMFIEGFRSPIRDHVPIFEEAIELAQVSGDKHLLLLSFGLIASCRLWQGDDMTDIENYCTFAAEDFGDWSKDVRGGTYLMAVRQTSRALQGKTWFRSAETVFSDDEHDSADYLRYVVIHASNPERPRDIYNSLMMIPLYLYGFHDKAIEVGSATAASIHQLWSIRNNRLNLFYLSLALISKIRDGSSGAEDSPLLDQVLEYKAQIDTWQTESNVNYYMWSLLIEAEVADLTRKYDAACLCYETAIDHTQLYDFLLEQALAFELQGEFFMRRGSKRAARSILLDSVATYARIGASGKADYLRAKHEWLLSNALNVRSVDAEAQTSSDMGHAGFALVETDGQQNANSDGNGDRTNDWVSPKLATGMGALEREVRAGGDVSELGLDVLDLQSILEFNQAISSELQIDRLLGKMTEIILESAGAQADLACVVVEGEGGWN
ncbi:MAG: hypothetical protein Q9177_001563, partial [Variospora cf. flavescens]